MGVFGSFYIPQCLRAGSSGRLEFSVPILAQASGIRTLSSASVRELCKSGFRSIWYQPVCRLLALGVLRMLV